MKYRAFILVSGHGEDAQKHAVESTRQDCEQLISRRQPSAQHLFRVVEQDGLSLDDLRNLVEDTLSAEDAQPFLSKESV